MPHQKIDFSKIKDELAGDFPSLDGEKEIRTVKPKSRGKRIIATLAIFLIILLLIWGIKSIFGSKDTSGTGFWTQLEHLITSRNKTLKGESDGRINILLLGIGGAGHDGPYLTDTIILASFQPKEKKVAFLSIPRDLVMPIPGYGWRKINDANAFGELQKPGHGAELTVETIQSVFQIPIQYYLLVDFDGFSEFIDQIGGVKICVDNSFTDNLYPTDDYKTQTVSFTAGCQMMNGQTALDFARSRHGNNNEGSDFARSRRQQKIILAAKDKLLSFSTLINPLNIKKLYNQYQNHTETNLEIWEMLRLADLGKGIGKENIISQGLGDAPGNYLQDVIGDDGAFLLQPPGGNYDEIRKLVANIFGTSPDATAEQNQAIAENKNSAPVVEAKKTQAEKAVIEVRNGTMIIGLAGKVQSHLQSLGFNAPTIGNTPLRDYEKNVIYVLSGKEFPQTIATLTGELNANVSSTIPGWMKNVTTADIMVILGQNAQKLNF